MMAIYEYSAGTNESRDLPTVVWQTVLATRDLDALSDHDWVGMIGMAYATEVSRSVSPG
jgi:hypothetical protein